MRNTALASIIEKSKESVDIGGAFGALLTVYVMNY